ncbi:MAG: hypothetical protein QOC56_843 [Alphaproteobacteria bacterium]|nr:hypothetical protein [Alphaproteobacteria bacterium]
MVCGYCVISELLGRIPGLDLAAGTLVLPFWIVGAGVALFAGLCLLAFSRAGRDGAIGGLARMALILMGAGVTWFVLDGPSRRDLAAERRALESRVLDLTARALMPGSALACLDGAAGDTVEASCEKALFASPEATAAAVSYVTMQLALLADPSDHAQRAGGGPAALGSLRRAAEADRYGLVARVLAQRDGCTPDQCGAFALLTDASRVSTNIAERTYDYNVVHHSGGWPALARSPTAAWTPPSALASPPEATTGLARPAAAASMAPGAAIKPPGPNVYFPSAASIPPVNIMSAEPAVAAPPPAAATPATPAAKPPPTPPRKPPAPGQPAAQGRTPVDLGAARAAPASASAQ